ncbi:XRE family transcriptional regulator [Sphingomonas jatrophae]|uniref:Phage repressor protein C, contains Cro/C1-type HTH and peptisase s24 domains n=1 Tax=Sphingomonas jatrophae TaxID=1166337 RepID=A0A1I6JLC6_9SPHN|nr:S24 family peptidase [Sphingomonas jatrophae]SFR79701.1 Phage repressor protein C, contains Cro/C1-type HTH and peptisase s24 domains [Sphingomonas jatrophae]
MIGPRIQERLTQLGMSQSELARRAGLTQSAINGLIRGAARGTKHLHVIARELQTTPAYLAGETEDPNLDATPRPTSADIANQLDSVLVPVASEEFTLGGGGEVEESAIVDHVPFARKWLRDHGVTRFDQLLLVPTSGDSMVPTISDGDMLLVDRARVEVRQPDLVWCFLVAGQGLVKRLRREPKGGFSVVSDNAAIYAPYSVAEDDVTIVGQVISALKWRL